MDKDFDFEGWATKNDIKCSDGRIIRQDAFKHNDGKKVPLVWNHNHNDPLNVLGHALLENREEGVYTYCKFNNTEAGKAAKELVHNEDITALSIYANQLKQQGSNVVHGSIREVSLVIAGANPGASIQSVIKHGEESEDEAVIYTGERFTLKHAEEDSEVEKEESEADDEETIEDVFNTLTEKQKKVAYALIGQALGDDDDEDESGVAHSAIEEGSGETIEDVWKTFTPKQQKVVCAMIGKALESRKVEHSDLQGGYKEMNVFEQNANVREENGVLSHSDQAAILAMAKQPNCGTLKHAIEAYSEDNDVMIHGFEDITELFPEYKNLGPAAPEFVQRDQSWVDYVMNGVHKSPISRIRTRQMDIRNEDLRALGYTNREIAKKKPGLMKLLKRTTDPQTVYRTDSLHRDDIIDIADFDVVGYQYQVMMANLKEELALAFLIGDGREDADEDKISEDHIRSIWHEDDEDLYAIHADVDIAKAKEELQGTNTSANFGENYIYAEAIITAALYSREKYKGSGNLDFFCTPHLLNVMLLARDLNGRRIYNSKADLAAALNVKAIHTVEQFEGKTRTTKDGKEKKLLGIFVNLADYQVGSTKGGQITRFEDFDIDFNQYKYLIETRLSGALTRVFSAIVLEEPVAASGE